MSEKYITKNREVNLDVIRCIAMLMVIMVHTMGNLAVYAEPYNKMWYISKTTESIVFACNGLFFMLSGYFVLNKEIPDIKKFYIGRLIKIAFPFFVFSLLYYVRTVYYGPGFTFNVKSIGNNVLEFVMQFLTGNISSHFWFMYYLIGAYIMAPFLDKMVHNLNDKELKYFTLISFILQTFITTISFTKWSFYHQAFLTFGLINWMFYFLVGYSIQRLVPKKKVKSSVLVFVFISMVVVALCEKRFLPVSNPYIDNQCSTMMITTIAIFLL